tara:strand:- start:91 stop:546 length:456 start_codon:yes stop_codon:yes gene_type:complete
MSNFSNRSNRSNFFDNNFKPNRTFNILTHTFPSLSDVKKDITQNTNQLDKKWNSIFKNKLKPTKRKETIPYGWVQYSFDKTTKHIIVKNLKNTDSYRYKHEDELIQQEEAFNTMVSRWEERHRQLNLVYADTSPTWNILEYPEDDEELYPV